MKILNIYGQETWHTEAWIVGNDVGLLALKDAIEEALRIYGGKTTTAKDKEPLFASDGEGYEVIVECHNDDWGCYAPEGSYWNKEESNPQYISLEREVKHQG